MPPGCERIMKRALVTKGFLRRFKCSKNSLVVLLTRRRVSRKEQALSGHSRGKKLRSVSCGKSNSFSATTGKDSSVNRSNCLVSLVSKEESPHESPPTRVRPDRYPGDHSQPRCATADTRTGNTIAARANAGARQSSRKGAGMSTLANAEWLDGMVQSVGGSFGVIVHPSPKARAIIVNVPGYRADIDGYNKKYRTLGTHLAARGVGAFIQMPNIERDMATYCHRLINDVLAVCAYARAMAPQMCTTREPDLFLMGFSAGGAAVAAAATRTGAKKVLLMEPSDGLSAWDEVVESLSRYTGDICIIVGSGPEAIGKRGGQRFFEAAKRAARREMVEIPNCDHQFRGTPNGQIMAKAPLWAFAGDRTFPSPEGGLVLY